MKKAEKDKISSPKIVCSHLKKLRAGFIQGAIVSGPCRAKSIPEKFQPKDQDLPDKFGRLLISFTKSGSNRRHKLTFFLPSGKRKIEWLVDNAGLGNYKKMLDAIWNVETGLQHRYPKDGFDAVWVVKKGKHEVLNREVKRIDELLEPLFAIKKYREWAGEVRANIKYDSSPWSDGGKVTHWSYLKWLDGMIVGPARETEQETTPVKEPLLASLKNPVTCRDVGLIIHKRSDNIAETLKRHKYPVVKSNRRYYCDAEHAGILWPKWKKHWQNKQNQ